MARELTVDVSDEVPGHAPNSSRPRFRPDIEGLRAVAVIAVVAYHSHVPGFGGGFVGVDVFLVISGFLITGQMLRSAEEPQGLRLLSFYGHRAQRILPAATVTIIGTLVGALVLQSPFYQQTAAIDARSAALFFSNIRFAAQTNYFQKTLPPSPFLQFWSLSLEEQFYLVFPAILLVILSIPLLRRAGQRRVAVVLGALAAVSMGVSIWAVNTDAPSATSCSRLERGSSSSVPCSRWSSGERSRSHDVSSDGRRGSGCCSSPRRHRGTARRRAFPASPPSPRWGARRWSSSGWDHGRPTWEPSCVLAADADHRPVLLLALFVALARPRPSDRSPRLGRPELAEGTARGHRPGACPPRCSAITSSNSPSGGQSRYGGTGGWESDWALRSWQRLCLLRTATQPSRTMTSSPPTSRPRR